MISLKRKGSEIHQHTDAVLTIGIVRGLSPNYL
jgi:hypothetical protein